MGILANDFIPLLQQSFTYIQPNFLNTFVIDSGVTTGIAPTGVSLRILSTAGVARLPARGMLKFQPSFLSFRPY